MPVAVLVDPVAGDLVAPGRIAAALSSQSSRSLNPSPSRSGTGVNAEAVAVLVDSRCRGVPAPRVDAGLASSQSAAVVVAVAVVSGSRTARRPPGCRQVDVRRASVSAVDRVRRRHRVHVSAPAAPEVVAHRGRDHIEPGPSSVFAALSPVRVSLPPPPRRSWICAIDVAVGLGTGGGQAGCRRRRAFLVARRVAAGAPIRSSSFPRRSARRRRGRRRACSPRRRRSACRRPRRRAGSGSGHSASPSGRGPRREARDHA